MADSDREVWYELHDLEQRVGRLEDDFVSRTTRSEDRHARGEAYRWFGGAVITLVSAAALVLSLHLF